MSPKLLDTAERLRAAVLDRYLVVNGDHLMTAEDDAYVDQHFVSLAGLAREEGVDVDSVRRLMIAGLVPLPSYMRSDGTEMVPRDLLKLAKAAGGAQHLPAWFQAQFDDPAEAKNAWADYLSGQYVCLREVSPANLQRKGELCTEIARRIDEPDPGSIEWLRALHSFVDELDLLEPLFAPYDRLRFGGPVSREQLIDDVRRRFPLDRTRGNSDR